LEEGDWLPEFAVVVAGLLAAEPIFIVDLGKVGEALLGEVEPGGLIGREDKSLENSEDPLETLVRADDHNPFGEHLLGGVMPEGEVGARIVGNVEVAGLLEQGAGVMLARED
jgi:hypothetical protein